MNITLLDRTKSTTVSAKTSTLSISSIDIQAKLVVINKQILAASTLISSQDIVYVDDKPLDSIKITVKL